MTKMFIFYVVGNVSSRVSLNILANVSYITNTMTAAGSWSHVNKIAFSANPTGNYFINIAYPIRIWICNCMVQLGTGTLSDFGFNGVACLPWSVIAATINVITLRTIDPESERVWSPPAGQIKIPFQHPTDKADYTPLFHYQSIGQIWCGADPAPVISRW